VCEAGRAAAECVCSPHLDVLAGHALGGGLNRDKHEQHSFLGIIQGIHTHREGSLCALHLGVGLLARWGGGGFGRAGAGRAVQWTALGLQQGSAVLLLEDRSMAGEMATCGSQSSSDERSLTFSRSAQFFCPIFPSHWEQRSVALSSPLPRVHCSADMPAGCKPCCASMRTEA